MHCSFRFWSLILLLPFLHGCQGDPDAANLRQEVLFHFESEGDSFKLDAARFLLDHLAEHEFLTNPKASDMIRMLKDSAGVNCPRRRDLIDSIHQVWKSSRHT